MHVKLGNYILSILKTVHASIEIIKFDFKDNLICIRIVSISF